VLENFSHVLDEVGRDAAESAIHQLRETVSGNGGFSSFEERGSLGPIPVKELGDQVVNTDGHPRAFAAFMCGFSEVRAFWGEDELDWEAYEICVERCKKEGVRTAADLKNRVVPPEQYRTLWLKRCREMQQEVEARRCQK